ncbi:MAG TPA: hypothetical protein VLL98_03890 [Rickettsiales bacterium]|nr:hypothetical protein [Rickettsiales bacterium]
MVILVLSLNPLAEKVASNIEFNINNTNNTIVNLDMGVEVLLLDNICALPLPPPIPLKESLSVCCRRTATIIKTESTICTMNKKLCKDDILFKL